ncbi:hypothetical protein [Halorubrum laminariae]|uniref:DUF5658 domain-containing protein n=1 Tax=Halorubrum laminariae TaxID=1433523 RepID=A0ABD6BZ72_9EURY|nr:hypothetical protein [Halorubrum laminariae]
MSKRGTDRQPRDDGTALGHRVPSERRRSRPESVRSVESRTGTRYGGADRSARARQFGRSALCLSGIALLTATKFADALTTGIGLRFVPTVYEANPAVDAVLRRVGVETGLIVSSCVLVVSIIAITEIAAVAVSIRRRDGHLAPLVRLVGYGLPSALFALVAVYNTTVIVAGLRSIELI